MYGGKLWRMHNYKRIGRTQIATKPNGSSCHYYWCSRDWCCYICCCIALVREGHLHWKCLSVTHCVCVCSALGARYAVNLCCCAFWMFTLLPNRIYGWCSVFTIDCCISCELWNTWENSSRHISYAHSHSLGDWIERWRRIRESTVVSDLRWNRRVGSAKERKMHLRFAGSIHSQRLPI